MRILFISKPYVARPHRRKLVYLAQNHGIEVGVICPHRWGNQTYESCSPEESGSLTIRSLPILLQGKNHFHYYRGLEDAIVDFAPDLVFIEEESYSYVTYQTFKITSRRKIPTMFYAWQNIEKSYPPPFRWFEKFIHKTAIAACGGSEEAGAILRRKGFNGPFAAIPQVGIDVDLFAIEVDIDTQKKIAKQQLDLPVDRFVCFYAGRIVEEKGIQVTLRALTALAERVFFVIVGSGPYEGELRSLAEKTLPHTSYRFVPHVSASDIPIYTQAADALVLSSLTTKSWKEQGPVRVVTESMSASTIAIVSDTVELPQVVEDTGIVYREGDAEDLARKLTQIIGDRATQLDLRERAYLRVQKKYSAKAVASQLAEFLQNEVSLV